MKIIKKELVGFGSFGSSWSDLSKDKDGRDIPINSKK